jgi:phage terminase small subunit
MTEQQQIFADQFLVDRNATQAALRAGYAVSSSRLIGHKLLNNKEVRAYIDAKLAEISSEAFVSVQWALNRYKDISDRCMQAEPVMVFDGEQWVESGEYKFDSAGAKAATDSIVKILGGFEKDNTQSKPDLVLPTVNVYNTLPPLAQDEKEVDV